jgi:RNA 3'-terminal phosphate cyclase-like protein
MTFFGVKFKISPAPKSDDADADATPKQQQQHGTGEVLVSCVGVGYSNVNRAMA